MKRRQRKHCVTCGREFVAYSPRIQFDCSPACTDRAERYRMRLLGHPPRRRITTKAA